MKDKDGVIRTQIKDLHFQLKQLVDHKENFKGETYKIREVVNLRLASFTNSLTQEEIFV